MGATSRHVRRLTASAWTYRFDSSFAAHRVSALQRTRHASWNTLGFKWNLTSAVQKKGTDGRFGVKHGRSTTRSYLRN